MIRLESDPSHLRLKFLNSVTFRTNLCEIDLDQVYECASKLSPQSNDYWNHSIKSKNNDLFASDWYNEMRTKTSLSDYMLIKESPCLETYLLNKTDFHAAALKFKLRSNPGSNTLPLERKLSKWTSESDGICKLCHNGVEDVTHFLFLCNAYETIRIDEFQKLENRLIYDSCADIWELFISSAVVVLILSFN